MPIEIVLAPMPKVIKPGNGVFRIPEKGFIVLTGESPGEMLFSAKRLNESFGNRLQITADNGGDPDENAVVLIIDPNSGIPGEGYTLDVSPERLEIRAATPAGIFYGVCTACQLAAQFSDSIPAVSIRDEPDFPVRGVMIDISRDKVMTLETAMELVDLLAGWKINHFELYMEHTFAYRNHPGVWENASPMTGQEILLLDQYCKERFIDLVPNQNSFSHMSRWFAHEEYLPMANTVGRFGDPGQEIEGSFTLAPGVRESIEFLGGLYDELLPHFSSRYFNVGCDEALDLQWGKSAELTKQIGEGQVYFDFLLKIYDRVKQHGRTMLFWGDIMLRHPELISELPKDAVALVWGYEPDDHFDKSGAKFIDAGVKIWNCPGTQSWMSMTGQAKECMINLRNAAKEGLANGASGYLNTDWGDNGHWQYLPVSYLGFIYGASVSWNSADDGSRIADALSIHAFKDDARLMGGLVYELGQVHHQISRRWNMGTIIWRQLFTPLSNTSIIDDTTSEEFDRASSVAERIASRLDDTRMARPDAELIKSEYRNAIAMIKLGCILAKIRIAMRAGENPDKSEAVELLKTIIDEHERLWLARNKPGGLADSRARMESRLDELTA